MQRTWVFLRDTQTSHVTETHSSKSTLLSLEDNSHLCVYLRKLRWATKTSRTISTRIWSGTSIASAAKFIVVSGMSKYKQTDR